MQKTDESEEKKNERTLFFLEAAVLVLILFTVLLLMAMQSMHRQMEQTAQRVEALERDLTATEDSIVDTTVYEEEDVEADLRELLLSSDVLVTDSLVASILDWRTRNSNICRDVE